MQTILRSVEQMSDRLLAAFLPQAEASAANCWWRNSDCSCVSTRQGKTGTWRRCCQYPSGSSCAGNCSCKTAGTCTSSADCPRP